METRVARPWMLTGVALILLVGLIHLMDAPDSMTESATKGLVSSTGRCNTLSFGCCLNRRCMSGEAGASWRVVCCRQEGAVGAVEGRGVN